jgi:histidyl-tRNA synthetase
LASPWASRTTCASTPAWCAGSSYYTGAVFEGFDAERRFRAIFGGGRYDNLFGDMTGAARPAVGMGFGDVVIAEILTELKGLTPAKPKVEVCVGMFDAALSRDAARIAAELVAAGIQTDLAFSAGKPGKFFAMRTAVARASLFFWLPMSCATGPRR